MILWFLLIIICRCLSQKQVWEKIFLPASPARQNTDSPKASPWESSQPGKIITGGDTEGPYYGQTEFSGLLSSCKDIFIISQRVCSSPTFLPHPGKWEQKFLDQQVAIYWYIGFLFLTCPQECSELAQPFTCSFLICLTDTMQRVGK